MTPVQVAHSLPELWAALAEAPDAMVYAGGTDVLVKRRAGLLHPPALAEAGLSGSLGQFLTGFGDRTGLRISLNIRCATESLPQADQLALFRVVQEALANAHRHARARCVSILLRRADGQDAAAGEGIAIAREIATALRTAVQGIQVSTQSGNIDAALAVVNGLR